MDPDSSVYKVLADFTAAGVDVFACGLCVEFYGLKDKIPKEQITNMYAICEYLFSADKVISPYNSVREKTSCRPSQAARP